MPTPSRRPTTAYAAGALCAVLALSACGSAGDGAAPSVQPSTMTSSPSQSPPPPGGTSPSMPPSGRARPTTMSGRVTSTAGGCTVFKSDRDATQWVLVGETTGLTVGTAYEVEGVAMDAMDPRCPQGLPFLVSRAAESDAEDLPVPTAPSSTKGPGVTTLTGVAGAGVEAGCRVLQTESGVFTLVGQVAVPDGRVEVRGVPRADMMTTCQQGTAFEVLSVRVLG